MQTHNHSYSVLSTPYSGPSRLYCLTFDYPPMHGGVARYLSGLVKASNGEMKVLVPLEHPRDAYSMDNDATKSPPSKRGEAKGGSIRFWWFGWPKWLPLIKRCLELKDGLILVSHVVPIGTAAWISKFLGGPDYVVLFHGTDLQRMRTAWRRWLLRRICSRARLLVTNSEATKAALKRLVPQTDALVLTPGVEKGNVLRTNRPTSHVKIREELGVDEDAKVVLAVCRLVERKGIDTLLQALDIIQNSCTELVVVGNGPYASSLHQLAELLKVRVRWVENANDEEVAKWYDAADIFCLPSREAVDDVEGFGIVFLEAASHGLSVIAGKGWGTEEAVVDGVTGLLVQPDAQHVADALQHLLDDPQLRQELGNAGRERVERDFGWEDRWRALKNAIEHPSCQRGVGEISDTAIIVPCYNHAHELSAALESIVQQTLQPREVIVVDNNSEDNPKTVVEKYKDVLPVTYIRYDEKQGAPAARNIGASLTSAPYLLFMDADVQLQPDALQRMFETLESNGDAAFAYSDFYWGRKLFKGREWNAEELKKANWINTASLIRRVAWVPFDENLNKFQDWDLWLMLAERGQKGIWIPEALLTVKEVGARKNNISHWLPAFMHKISWPVFGWMPNEIRKYRAAETIIRKKHNI